MPGNDRLGGLAAGFADELELEDDDELDEELEEGGVAMAVSGRSRGVFPSALPVAITEELADELELEKDGGLEWLLNDVELDELELELVKAVPAAALFMSGSPPRAQPDEIETIRANKITFFRIYNPLYVYYLL